MPKRLRESDGVSKLADTMGSPRKQRVHSTAHAADLSMFALGFRPSFTTPKGKGTPRMSKEIAKRDAKEFARFIDSNSRDLRGSSQFTTPVKQKGVLLQPSPSTLLPSKKPLQPIPDPFAFLPISSRPPSAFESPKTRSTPRMPLSHPQQKLDSSTDPKVTPKRVLPLPPPPPSIPGWRDSSSKALVTPSTTRVVERFEFGSLRASGSCITDLGDVHSRAGAETARGPEISPPKDWREPGRNGFIRNGLAERASSLIETNEIRFALWHAEILRSGTTAPLPLSNKLKPFAVSTPVPAPKRLKYMGGPPGMRFRIANVITNDDSRGKESRGLILAQCTIVSSRPRDSGLIGLELKDLEGEADAEGVDEAPKGLNQQRLVLFSLPLRQLGTGRGGLGICSRETLVVGREVMVWEPWYEVTLAKEQGMNGKDSSTLFYQRAMLCSRFQAV